MVSIISLPYEALEDVFSNVNQQQALVFAPLHSKLQNVIKKKLYENILVYRVGDVQSVNGEESKGEWHYFRYPKHINNLKSNKYTIISSYTFERYLTSMDRDMKISNLEINEHYVVLLDSLFNHFKYIKNLELGSDCQNRNVYYLEELQFFSCFEALDMSEPCLNTYYMIDGSCSGIMMELKQNVTKLKIKCLHKYSTVKSLNLLLNLKTLYLYEPGDKLGDLHFSHNIKLKKLHLCGFICPSNEFTISKVFNTSKLEELYIQGSLGPNIQGMFSPSGLDVEYPRLIQLGIDSDSCNLRRLAQILSYRTHNKPQSLIIVHPRKSWKSYLPQLCVSFPNASINWWHLWDCPATRKSFLDTASIFSPNLPRGVVGYHHYDEASKWISKRVFPCELYGNKRMNIELQKWYSNTDLDMISCDPLNPHDVHSEECKL